MKLSELGTGDFGKIVWVAGSGPIHARLMDMGLVRGVIVEVIRRAPMGGPFEIRVKGTLLSLRPEEARMLSVVPVERRHMGRGRGMGGGRRKGRGRFMGRFFRGSNDREPE